MSIEHFELVSVVYSLQNMYNSTYFRYKLLSAYVFEEVANIFHEELRWTAMERIIR